MAIDSKKLDALKNAIIRASDSEQRTEDINAQVREGLKLGAELLAGVINDLEEIKQDYKKHDFSKENLSVYFEEEKRRQEFIEMECRLLRIAGWRKSDLDDLEKVIEQATRAPILEEPFDLDLFINRLRATKNAMEKASQNEQDSIISKYLKFKDNEFVKIFVKILGGGAMISVNILAPQINPNVAAFSVEKGGEIAIDGIRKLWEILTSNDQHSPPPSPPPPPPSIRIDTENRIVWIDDVALHIRKKHF